MNSFLFFTFHLENPLALCFFSGSSKPNSSPPFHGFEGRADPTFLIMVGLVIDADEDNQKLSFTLCAFGKKKSNLCLDKLRQANPKLVFYWFICSSFVNHSQNAALITGFMVKCSSQDNTRKSYYLQNPSALSSLRDCSSGKAWIHA